MLTLAVTSGALLFTMCLGVLRPIHAILLYQQQPGAKNLVVADFEDDDWRMTPLNAPASCWGSESSSISCQQMFEGSRGMLRMQYDTTQDADAFALYSAGLNGLNAVSYHSVWVSLKGEAGGEKLYVELKDCGQSGEPQYPKVLIADYLSGGISTTAWSAVNIPLTAFEAITDFTCIDQVNVLAHNDIDSGQGAVFIDDIRLLSSSVLVDDFHDQVDRNELGALSGFWNNPEDADHVSYSFPNGELMIDYDVTASNGAIREAIFWTGLRRSSLVTGKGALSFDIRGAEGQEQLAIEFRDCGLDGERHIPKVKISDYLPHGISMVRQNVQIPLSAFGDDIDWSCIENQNFLVSSVGWLDSQRGIVYLDNVTLSGQSVPIMVDNFSDCNQQSAMFTNWYTDTNRDAELAVQVALEDDTAPDLGCRYYVDYSIRADSSAWFGVELPHLDVSNYTHLSFRIQGDAGNEEPHVYLADSQGQYRFYDNIRPTQNWQEVRIPLSYFGAAVDLQNLVEFHIAFEWKTMSGAVSIDEVRFVNSKYYLPLVARPEPPGMPTPVGFGCEREDQYAPNNNRSEADFELASDTPIQSTICGPEDVEDYFVMRVAEMKRVEIRLTNVPDGVDYDLYLYDGATGARIEYSIGEGSSDEQISYLLGPGLYYVNVYPYSLELYPDTGFSDQPYTLVASFD